MAKLNARNLHRAIDRAGKKTIRTRIRGFLEQYATENIVAQTGADGKPFPRKADSTIEQYRRRGWNTEQFLIRTGQSVKLTFSQTATSVRMVPFGATDAGDRILEFHDPSRVQWLTPLPDDFKNRVLRIFADDVERILR